MTSLKIVETTAANFDPIWTIFEPVVRAGDTYPHPPDITYDQAKALWSAPKMRLYLAYREEQPVGVYYLKPNQPGLGSHVANAGYMVHPETRGQGIGKQLGKHSIEEALRLGYRAMQFNFVVSTNTAGVRTWQSLGFEIIGTIPEGYHHQTLGFVDAYIMYQGL